MCVCAITRSSEWFNDSITQDFFFFYLLTVLVNLSILRYDWLMMSIQKYQPITGCTVKAAPANHHPVGGLCPNTGGKSKNLEGHHLAKTNAQNNAGKKVNVRPREPFITNLQLIFLLKLSV